MEISFLLWINRYSERVLSLIITDSANDYGVDDPPPGARPDCTFEIPNYFESMEVANVAERDTLL